MNPTKIYKFKQIGLMPHVARQGVHLAITLLAVCALYIFQSNAFAGPSEEAAQSLLEEAAISVFPAVQDYYHQIHQYPELGKKEFITSKFVRDRLIEAGITNFVEVASLPTAIVAILDTGKPGKTIALRSELDARPGQETTGLPFSSTISNQMHSCGHDAHAAILIGVAKVIHRHSDLFAGRVVFLFQPAEETAGGADDIVRDGVLTNLHVCALLAQHSAAGLPVGQFQVSARSILAGSSYFTVRITGKDGHAAAPHETDDVLAGAAMMVSEVTRMPARSLDVLQHPCVVSVTYLNSGQTNASNVLPSEAQFRGTIRSFDSIDEPIAGTNSIRSLFMRTLTGIAAARGLSLQVQLRSASPPTINSLALYTALVPELRKRLGNDELGEGQRGMFSEDFAFYTPEVPCLYFALGIEKNGLGTESVHTEKFTIHPEALHQGVRLLTQAAHVMMQPDWNCPQ